MVCFFFNDPATTEVYTLSLHDALPIWDGGNVKMSADSGATWTLLLPEDDYPEDAVYTGNTGIPGEQAFSGTSNGNFWHTVQFSIDSLSGADTLIQFRFDFGRDRKSVV